MLDFLEKIGIESAPAKKPIETENSVDANDTHIAALESAGIMAIKLMESDTDEQMEAINFQKIQLVNIAEAGTEGADVAKLLKEIGYEGTPGTEADEAELVSKPKRVWFTVKQIVLSVVRGCINFFSKLFGLGKTSDAMFTKITEKATTVLDEFNSKSGDVKAPEGKDKFKAKAPTIAMLTKDDAVANYTTCVEHVKEASEIVAAGTLAGLIKGIEDDKTRHESVMRDVENLKTAKKELKSMMSAVLSSKIEDVEVTLSEWKAGITSSLTQIKSLSAKFADYKIFETCKAASENAKKILKEINKTKADELSKLMGGDAEATAVKKNASSYTKFFAFIPKMLAIFSKNFASVSGTTFKEANKFLKIK